MTTIDPRVETRPEGLGKASAWLYLPPDQAERLHDVLARSEDPAMVEILARLRTCLSDVSADEAFRGAAIDKYVSRLSDGDLDFDTDGMVSKGDEGAYVMAFLWVTNAEAGIEGPEFDDEDGIPEP